LNLFVKRLAASPAAVAEMNAYYDTTGVLTRPLVTLHTRYDQQVPIWHESLYGLKVLASGSLGLFLPITVERYGHCNFNAAEALVSFVLLVWKAEGVFRDDAERVLPKALRPEYRRLARTRGLPIARN
jgi:hypothetical protein